MTTHAIGYDPDIFVLMYQYRIFIFFSDVPGIGHAVTEYLEADWGLLIVICSVARQRNSF